MPEQMSKDQAATVVRKCYTSGQTQADAAEQTGYSRSWVAAEYRRLKACGISRVAGQLELFDAAG